MFAQLLGLYVEVPTTLGPQTRICSFCYEGEFCHWGSRRWRVSTLAPAATRKTEGSCSNRLLATRPAKIHIPDGCFTPASLSTLLSFLFKSGLNTSNPNGNAIMGNATFISLVFAAWVGTPSGNLSGGQESWPVVPIAVLLLGNLTSMYTIPSMVNFWPTWVVTHFPHIMRLCM